MKQLIVFAATVFLLPFISCTSTKIVSNWRETDKEITLGQLNKVLVLALFKDETSRFKAEDQMVQYLNGKGVASYSYLKSGFNENNEEALRRKIKRMDLTGP